MIISRSQRNLSISEFFDTSWTSCPRPGRPHEYFVEAQLTLQTATKIHSSTTKYPSFRRERLQTSTQKSFRTKSWFAFRPEIRMPPILTGITSGKRYIEACIRSDTYPIKAHTAFQGKTGSIRKILYLRAGRGRRHRKPEGDPARMAYRFTANPPFCSTATRNTGTSGRARRRRLLGTPGTFPSRSGGAPAPTDPVSIDGARPLPEAAPINQA